MTTQQAVEKTKTKMREKQETYYSVQNMRLPSGATLFIEIKGPLRAKDIVAIYRMLKTVGHYSKPL